jgi:exopolysaccharide biosynthesis polyprenyl glycosylphosphotransferase
VREGAFALPPIAQPCAGEVRGVGDTLAEGSADAERRFTSSADRSRPDPSRNDESSAQTSGQLVALDGLAVVASVGVGLLVTRAAGGRLGPAWLIAVLVPSVLVAFALNGMYRSDGLRRAPAGIATLGRVARALPVAALLVIVSLLLSDSTRGGTALVVTFTALAPALICVPGFRWIAGRLGRRTSLGRPQRVLIVGSGDAADAVASRLARHGGMDVVGMVDDAPLPGFQTMGEVRDIAVLCADHKIDRIIVAVPKAPWLTVSEAIQPLIGSVGVSVVPSLYELVPWRSSIQDLAGMPLVPLTGAQRNRTARAAKRAMDIICALVLLLALSPLLLVAASAIRLDSPGPVFFRQQRSGLRGRTFSIWKFRTMRVGADEHRQQLRSDLSGERLFKLRRDPRVTRVGAFLRRYSIDEMPQLLNVLSGQMSLVGPRPYPLDESEALRFGPAGVRFEMLPGITGLWQVSGRSDLSWDDLCRLDAMYVRSWSLSWDLRILLQTPAAVLRGHGAY